MKRILFLAAVFFSVNSIGIFSETPGNDDDNNDDENPMNSNLKITVGSVSFSAVLEDNTTTKVFRKLLPMTVNMSELNGDEKRYQH